MNNRIISFDVIRGLSAIFVLLFHYTVRFNQYSINDSHFEPCFTVPWGFAAVSTFFILSGYFSAKQLAETKPVPWGGYFMKRFKRLYPAFFFAVILTFTTTKLFLPELSCSLKDFAINFSMMPGLFRATPVDGAYWTLFVEWVFYFIVAALLIKPNKILTNITLFGWIVLSILSVLIFGKDPNGIPKVVNYFLVTNYSACFVAGISLWQIAKKKATLATYILLILSCLSQTLWQNIESIVFFALTVFFILLVSITELDKFLHKSRCMNLLAWYGRISYPFYLVHQVIGYVILYYLIKTGVSSTWIIVIPFIIITCIGYILNEYSERAICKLLQLFKIKI